MEVYILDSLLRREEVIDRFESLIWTERYADVGDFNLVIQSTRTSRMQFTAGTRLATNTSYRVMTVETVENSTDAEGKKVLKVAGRSIEALLEDRVAKNSHANLTDEPKWVLGGTPGDIGRQIFHEICRVGRLSLDDRIPFIQSGTIFAPSTIPEPETPIIVQFEPITVLQAIKNLCALYDLGFRLVRNFDMSQLYFDIYSGHERTTRQRLFPPVVFSAEQDNLQNTRELETIENSKNVAYVYSAFGSLVVYGENVPSDVDGFDRRVLLVNATEIDENTPDVPAALYQKGVEELSKARGVSAFDGELNQYSSFKYGIDYELGDITELRNEDDIITYKRVTEQIFVHDAEGERSYPTLALNQFVSSDTWASQLGRVWEDFTTEEWADM